MMEIAKKHGVLRSRDPSTPPSRRTRSSERTSREADPDDLPRSYIDQMKPELPRLFGRLPKADVEVDAGRGVPREGGLRRPVQPAGAKDGSRPGRDHGEHERARDAADRSRWSRRRTTKGVPGAPPADRRSPRSSTTCRRSASRPATAAFVEGWALYSERLGKEIGFYQDPYSDYGRLQDEMLRAIRLVVDTGFHYEAVDPRTGRPVLPRPLGRRPRSRCRARRTATSRGRARRSAYKIGQLRILELRERAQKGARQPFRRPASSTTQILGAGALPLDVLGPADRRVDRGGRKSAKSS